MILSLQVIFSPYQLLHHLDIGILGPGYMSECLPIYSSPTLSLVSENLFQMFMLAEVQKFCKKNRTSSMLASDLWNTIPTKPALNTYRHLERTKNCFSAMTVVCLYNWLLQCTVSMLYYYIAGDLFFINFNLLL